MSSKKCPIPPLTNFKIGTSFKGNISSIYNADKGLIYILSEKQFHNFSLIESFNPDNAYTKPPGFGETFLYRNVKNLCYRAYRLSSNPSDYSGIRAFLFDIGKEIFQNFRPKRFFKMPLQFAVMNPMGLFCYVRSIPKELEEAKSVFLKKSLLVFFHFNITRETRLDSALGKNHRCLEVDIEEPEENIVEELEDEESDDDTEDYYRDFYERSKKNFDVTPDLPYYPRLTYTDNYPKTDYSDKFDELEPEKETFPLNGSKIMVFIMEVVSPTSMYARLLKQSDVTLRKYEESKSSSQLVVWMNDEDVVESYQKLLKEPEVSDLVVAVGRDHLYQRGRVTGKDKDSFKIFFIDFGYTLNIALKNLFKFPREFTTSPAQAAHLRITNTEILEYKPNKLEIVQTIKSILDPFGVAHVNSSSYENYQLNLSVQLYDGDGINLSDAVASRIPNLNESVYDFSDYE